MNKKQQREDPTKIENSIINLGFVESLYSQITANELAAKGMKLTIKSEVIKFIKNLDDDKQTQASAELLQMLQSNNNATLNNAND